MSRGLGVMQRKMLTQLAEWEVNAAEQAAMRQETCGSPLIAPCALWQIVKSLGLWELAGYHWSAPRFNPSRVMSALCARGLVHRQWHTRVENLRLTKAGFAEVLRLGVLRPSEIIDYDRLLERWDETLVPTPIRRPDCEATIDRRYARRIGAGLREEEAEGAPD